MYLSHTDMQAANDEADRSITMLATVILLGFSVGVVLTGVGLWVWLS
jgi:hypothetical protein